MLQRNYDSRYTSTPCKWLISPTMQSPHTTEVHKARPKICSSILEAIGNTPIVRINNLTKQESICCEILVKCEYLNPGGSIKDRVGLRMITDLEKSGRLSKGMKIVEPTSGNTGIGLALSAAVKGYSLTSVVSKKVSQEKVSLLRSLGSEVIQTPSEVSFNDPANNVSVAESLERNNEEIIMAGQHFNPSNPLAHYDHTAEEIIDQLDYRLDFVVICTGTGGQITGLSRKLKEKIPGVQIVAVDPLGSIVRDPDHIVPGSYKTEGMGSKILARVADTGLVDQWFVCNDQDNFKCARKLIRYEGLLVGGSSGAAMFAALQLGKTLTADKRVLVILSDGVRNYMTKFLNDRWMVLNGFMHLDQPNGLIGKTVRDLALTPCRTCHIGVTVLQVLEIMKTEEVKVLPVLDGQKVISAVEVSQISKLIVQQSCKLSDLLDKVVDKDLKVLKFDTSLAFLSICLEEWNFAVIQEDDFISVIYPIDLTLVLLN